MSTDEETFNPNHEFETLELACKQGWSVEFLPPSGDWEHYVESGMRAKLVKVVNHDPKETDPHYQVWELHVDFEPFDEYNKAFESTNYYDDKGHACLTAREANLYKPQDVIYIGPGQFGTMFSPVDKDLVNSHEKVQAEFRREGTQEPYIAWLERRLAEHL